MELLVLTADEVREALPMADAIQAMKDAYAQLSSGEAVVPLRSRVQVPVHEIAALFMPAYLPAAGSLAVKIVSVAPRNAGRGLPTIHALVLALDAETGVPLALLEGGALTAIRTGAGSGAATDALARPEASTAVIFGSGAQARTQLEAVCTVRPITRVLVYSPNSDHAAAFARDVAGRGPIPEAVEAVTNPNTAAAEADVLCAATTSITPVFDGRELKPGAHVNAVGSFTPEMQEIDLTTLRRSLVVVDSRAAVLEESGDLLVPIQRGEYTPDEIHAEIGEVLRGHATGRTDPDQITLFNSVGVAAQDAAAAGRALEGAARAGLGRTIGL